MGGITLGNVTPVFIFNSLDIVRGGLTKAVLTRANTLVEYFPETQFFTLLYQRDHKEIIQKLYESGKLDKRIKVHNFFLDAIPSKDESKINSTSVIQSVKEQGLIEFIDSGSKQPAYRYYQNGLYVKYKKFDKQQRLMFIDYMDEGRHRTRREEFDPDGNLSRIQHMDLVTNTPKLERYVDSNGECFLSIWVNPKSKKSGRCLLFHPKPREFNDISKLYAFWIAEKIKHLNHPILMSDSRATDEVLLNIKENGVKKIAICHNNHFTKPYTKDSEIKKTWVPLLTNLNEFDRVVLLTNEQREDIEETFGNRDILRVIPHSVQPIETSHQKVEPSPYLAVTLARYNVQKRLDEAIKAFQFVVEKIPNAEYHIYGFGSEEDKLKDLISKLKLQKHVFLKGFTNDAVATYQSACCSILTSDYEGFGLVMTESLAAGTPVVAYDIKYGPRDIIRDGVDGYLVPKGDQKQLAEKIIYLMENPNIRKQFSEHAKDVFQRFNYEDYKRQWKELFMEFEPNNNENQEIEQDVEEKQEKRSMWRMLFKK